MTTYLIFGKYSSESMKEISKERTEKTVSLFKKFGGEVKSMYALLGEQDLVFIVDLPGIEQAMKASVALNKSTNISFKTSSAVTVEEFDKLMAEM